MLSHTVARCVTLWRAVPCCGVLCHAVWCSPLSARFLARLRPVCPPIVGRMASGRSCRGAGWWGREQQTQWGGGGGERRTIAGSAREHNKFTPAGHCFHPQQPPRHSKPCVMRPNCSPHTLRVTIHDSLQSSLEEVPGPSTQQHTTHHHCTAASPQNTHHHCTAARRPNTLCNMYEFVFFDTQQQHPPCPGSAPPALAAGAAHLTGSFQPPYHTCKRNSTYEMQCMPPHLVQDLLHQLWCHGAHIGGVSHARVSHDGGLQQQAGTARAQQ